MHHRWSTKLLSDNASNSEVSVNSGMLPQGLLGRADRIDPPRAMQRVGADRPICVKCSTSLLRSIIRGLNDASPALEDTF